MLLLEPFRCQSTYGNCNLSSCRNEGATHGRYGRAMACHKFCCDSLSACNNIESHLCEHHTISVDELLQASIAHYPLSSASTIYALTTQLHVVPHQEQNQKKHTMCGITLVTCQTCRIMTGVRMSHCPPVSRTLANDKTPSEWNVLGKFTWSPMAGCRGLDVDSDIQMTRNCQHCKDQEDSSSENARRFAEFLDNFSSRPWWQALIQEHLRQQRDGTPEPMEEGEITEERDREDTGLVNPDMTALRSVILAAWSR
jgi:hypothetical protein